MGKDYTGKWFTKVEATAKQVTTAGSNVFYGRAPVTNYTVVISTTAVKSNSVILFNIQHHQTSVAFAGSYYTLPHFFVTSIYDSKTFCLATVVASNTGNTFPVSCTAMWMIANPA